MSDVSGIPYMGPMGTGNFFAPQFSNNPQMSAGQISAPYAGPSAYNQNVVNNLFSSGGGFGRQTDYYSQLAANQLSGIGSTNPYGVFSNTGQSAYAPAFDQGAMDNFATGGGGYNFPSIPNYSGGLEGLWGGGGGLGSSGFSTRTLQDWAGNWNAPQQASPFDFGSGGGAGLFSSLGGLGGAGYTPSPSQPSLDWSKLFDGGGGARADPAPGMAMPGGLGAPMTLPQPRVPAAAPTDPYPGMAMPGGLGAPMTTQPSPQPAGSTAAQPSSVFDTGAAPITGTEFTGPYGGGRGVGGLDQGATTGQPYTAPAEPQRGMLGAPVTEAYNPYFDVTSPSSQRSGGEVVGPGGGLTATDLSEQAKTRLAELMGRAEGPPEPAKIPEPPGGVPAVPLPRRRPEEAPASEPSAPFDQPSLEQFQRGVLGARQDALSTLKQELAASNLIMTSGYRDPTNPLSQANPASAHSQGRAFDVRARTPEQADAAIGQIHELLGARGLVEGRDYRIIDEVRKPSAWATGPHVHTQFTEEGMQRYQREVYQDPNPPRPPADIPFPGGVPLPADRPDAAGQRPVEAAAPAGESPATQLYPGTDVPRPPADIPAAPADVVPLPTARPAAANIAQAHSLLNTTVGDLVQKNSPSDAGRVPSSIASQTLREALGNTITGGMIRSGIEPYLPKLGVTAAEFDKAYTQGQAVPPRFSGAPIEGTEPAGAPAGSAFWEFPKQGTPRWNAEVYEPAFSSMVMRRPEQETAGGASHYADFPRTGNIEDRRNEILPAEQLAALKARAAQYYGGPEVAPTPLSAALGLGDLPMPRTGQAAGLVRPTSFAGEQPGDISSGMPDMERLLGYTPQQWPPEAYPNAPTYDDPTGGFGGAFMPQTTATEEFIPTRSITERASSPAAEEMQRLYGGVGNPDIGPPKYSGFEQPYGPKLAPGAYTREQFENRADYTAQDQAERLAAQRMTAGGAQLERDPAMMDRLVATITAEVGRGSTDTVKAALAESLLNRQNIRLSGAGGARNTVDPATGLNFSDLNRLGLLSTGQTSYYEPFRSMDGRTPTINAAQQEVARNPAYAEHVREIVRDVIRGGTNVSNLGSENASDAGQQLMGTWARQEQSPGWYDPGPGPRETFPRYDITPAAGAHNTPDARLVQAAQDWVRNLQPTGYVDPMTREQRWQAIANNPYGRR